MIVTLRGYTFFREKNVYPDDCEIGVFCGGVKIVEEKIGELDVLDGFIPEPNIKLTQHNLIQLFELMCRADKYNPEYDDDLFA